MKILLFDGNSIINRAFYGIRPLTNKEGLNTNAIYGFLNIYLKAIKEEMPDCVCIAFDLKAPTFRHKMYDGYKAQRKGMPEELAQQMPVLKELLHAMNIPLVEKEGYEADDLIGTLSEFCGEGDECIIYTGDRDSFQLISPAVRVKLAIPKKGQSESVVYDEEKIKEEYGISPEKIVDLKAIAGDTSDNIPGVAGIGEKGALKLIQKYGGFEEIYKDIDALDEKIGIKDKLKASEDNARLSLTLARIDKNAPLAKESLSDFKLQPMNEAKVKEILEKLEFQSFLKKFEMLGNETVKKEPQKTEPVLFSGDLEDLFQRLKLKERISYLLKQDGVEFFLGEETFLVLTDSYSQDIKKFLQQFFEDCGIKKITLDVKSDIIFLNKIGIDAKGFAFDLSIGAYLCDPSLKSYDLDALSQKYLDEGETLKPDAERVFLIWQKLLEAIKQANMEKLYTDLEFPLIFVLADMEKIGFKVDKDKLLAFGEELKETLKGLEQAIFFHAGGEFNINSSKQLGVILFEKLGLPQLKKTKTGYSTNAEVLDELLPYHEIIALIKEYRQVSKLVSTYVEGLSTAINPQDKRIHSSFNQTVTQTGRISSTEPNLQNIPVRTSLGREMRKVFVAEKGSVLIDADYSQIELRVLAHVANDETMIEAFKNDEDIHSVTASQVFANGNTPTAEMRSKAKAVNFGIVYGIGEFSLAKDLKITRKQAKEYIDNYLKKYSGVKQYMDESIAFAKKEGFVTTIFNRRRYIPEIQAKNFATRSFGERVAMNTPIQGSAADIIKIAMVNVSGRLREEKLKARLILQVHDELIIECPAEESKAVRGILKEEMEGAVSLKVPLKIDVSEGETWYDAKG